MELEYGVHSIIGKKSRPNEDRYRLLGSRVPLVAKAEQGQIFAVFDGIGSAPMGRDAAQYMCDSLVDFFKRQPSHKPGAQILDTILRAASSTVNDWGTMGNTTRPLGGCAGTVAWFFNNEITLFHAGDTIDYLLRGENIAALTREHGNGKTIVNYFGLSDTQLLIDTPAVPLEDGDIIILVSDGITKSLSSPDIAQCVHHQIAHSSERAARMLCELADIKGSQDDITALIVEVIDLEDS